MCWAVWTQVEVRGQQGWGLQSGLNDERGSGAPVKSSMFQEGAQDILVEDRFSSGSEAGRGQLPRNL